MIRLASWLVRLALRRAERRINPWRFNRAPSLEVDRLTKAIESLEATG